MENQTVVDAAVVSNRDPMATDPPDLFQTESHHFAKAQVAQTGEKVHLLRADPADLMPDDRQTDRLMEIKNRFQVSENLEIARNLLIEILAAIAPKESHSTTEEMAMQATAH